MELKQLKSRLQRRAGDTPNGNNFWDADDYLDAFNTAQEEVAFRATSSELPWANVEGFTVAVVDEAESYVLPKNCLSVSAVGHRISENNRVPVKRGDVRAMRLSQPDYTQTYYRYYDDSGVDAPFFAYGVATGGSPTTLVDTDSTYFSQMKVGDVVFNENDHDAYATIEAINIGSQTLTLGEWTGGQRRAISADDQYKIRKRELDRKVLSLFPKVSTDSVTVAESTGGSTVLSVPDTRVVTQATLTLNPDPTWDEDTDIALRILTGSTVVQEFGINNPKKVNHLSVIPFQLLHTTYTLSLMDNNTDISSRIVATKFNYFDLNNILEIDYVPTPKPFIDDNSVCEVIRADERLREPIILYAKMLLWEMRDPQDEMNLYNMHIQAYENAIGRALQRRRATNKDKRQKYVKRRRSSTNFYPPLPNNEAPWIKVIR